MGHPVCEVIVNEGGEIVLYSKDKSRVLGRYPYGEGKKYKNAGTARAAAEEREREVQFFKHQSSAAVPDIVASVRQAVDRAVGEALENWRPVAGSISSSDLDQLTDTSDKELVPNSPAVTTDEGSFPPEEEEKSQPKPKEETESLVCVCPQCSTRLERDSTETPCSQLKCPKCGAAMQAEKQEEQTAETFRLSAPVREDMEVLTPDGIGWLRDLGQQESTVYFPNERTLKSYPNHALYIRGVREANEETIPYEGHTIKVFQKEFMGALQDWRWEVEPRPDAVTPQVVQQVQLWGKAPDREAAIAQAKQAVGQIEQLVASRRPVRETVYDQVANTYDQIKQLYPDKVVLVRFKDDFMAFDQDADVLVSVCDRIKSKAAGRWMAFFQPWNVEAGIAELIDAGHAVAVAEPTTGQVQTQASYNKVTLCRASRGRGQAREVVYTPRLLKAHVHRCHGCGKELETPDDRAGGKNRPPPGWAWYLERGVFQHKYCDECIAAGKAKGRRLTPYKYYTMPYGRYKEAQHPIQMYREIQYGQITDFDKGPIRAILLGLKDAAMAQPGQAFEQSLALDRSQLRMIAQYRTDLHPYGVTYTIIDTAYPYDKLVFRWGEFAQAVEMAATIKAAGGIHNIEATRSVQLSLDTGLIFMFVENGQYVFQTAGGIGIGARRFSPGQEMEALQHLKYLQDHGATLDQGQQTQQTLLDLITKSGISSTQLTPAMIQAWAEAQRHLQAANTWHVHATRPHGEFVVWAESNGYPVTDSRKKFGPGQEREALQYVERLQSQGYMQALSDSTPQDYEVLRDEVEMWAWAEAHPSPTSSRRIREATFTIMAEPVVGGAPEEIDQAASIEDARLLRDEHQAFYGSTFRVWIEQDGVLVESWRPRRFPPQPGTGRRVLIASPNDWGWLKARVTGQLMDGSRSYIVVKTSQGAVKAIKPHPRNIRLDTSLLKRASRRRPLVEYTYNLPTGWTRGSRTHTFERPAYTTNPGGRIALVDENPDVWKAWLIRGPGDEQLLGGFATPNEAFARVESEIARVMEGLRQVGGQWVLDSPPQTANGFSVGQVVSYHDGLRSHRATITAINYQPSGEPVFTVEYGGGKTAQASPNQLLRGGRRPNSFEGGDMGRTRSFRAGMQSQLVKRVGRYAIVREEGRLKAVRRMQVRSLRAALAFYQTSPDEWMATSNSHRYYVYLAAQPYGTWGAELLDAMDNVLAQSSGWGSRFEAMEWARSKEMGILAARRRVREQVVGPPWNQWKLGLALNNVMQLKDGRQVSVTLDGRGHWTFRSLPEGPYETGQVIYQTNDWTDACTWLNNWQAEVVRPLVYASRRRFHAAPSRLRKTLFLSEMGPSGRPDYKYQAPYIFYDRVYGKWRQDLRYFNDPEQARLDAISKGYVIESQRRFHAAPVSLGDWPGFHQKPVRDQERFEEWLRREKGLDPGHMTMFGVKEPSEWAALFQEYKQWTRTYPDQQWNTLAARRPRYHRLAEGAGNSVCRYCGRIIPDGKTLWTNTLADPTISSATCWSCALKSQWTRMYDETGRVIFDHSDYEEQPSQSQIEPYRFYWDVW